MEILDLKNTPTSMIARKTLKFLKIAQNSFNRYFFIYIDENTTS